MPIQFDAYSIAAIVAVVAGVIWSFYYEHFSN